MTFILNNHKERCFTHKENIKRIKMSLNEEKEGNVIHRHSAVECRCIEFLSIEMSQQQWLCEHPLNPASHTLRNSLQTMLCTVELENSLLEAAPKYGTKRCLVLILPHEAVLNTLSHSWIWHLFKNAKAAPSDHFFPLVSPRLKSSTFLSTSF